MSPIWTAVVLWASMIFGVIGVVGLTFIDRTMPLIEGIAVLTLCAGFTYLGVTHGPIDLAGR